MHVYVVGNSLVSADNLPIKLLPKLKKAFPRATFNDVDPNENFVPEEGSVIIDTVEGMSNVQLFTDLHDFVVTKSVSPHDYDLGFHLLLLFKLGKLKDISIIGIPSEAQTKDILRIVKRVLKKLMDNRKCECQK